MSRAQKRQSGGELASGGAPTRAQAATVQISPIRPVRLQHACRRPQHFPLSTPSRLAIDTADLPRRGGSAMVRCRRRSVRPDQPLPPFIPTPVTVTKPARVIAGFGVFSTDLILGRLAWPLSAALPRS